MPYNSKPSFYPRFAINDVVDGGGRDNVTEPDTSKKNSGWNYLEKPARDYMNWIHRGNYLWIDYFDQFWNSSHQFKINEVISETGTGINFLEPIGYGIAAPVTNIQIHQGDSGASLAHFTNTTTGATASDGFDIGIDASEQGRIWNYENTDLIIGTNNAEFLKLNNAGTIDLSYALDVNGVIGVRDGGTKTYYGGIMTEVSGGILNFGSNDGSPNRFGGSYTQAKQGGFLRITANDTYGELFKFFGRQAGVAGDASLLATMNSAGVTTILNTTDSTSKDTGAWIVEGGAGIEKNLSIGGDLQDASGNPVAGWLSDGTPYYIKEVSVTIANSAQEGSAAHGISNAFTNDRIFHATARRSFSTNIFIMHDSESDGNRADPAVGSIFWGNTNINLHREGNTTAYTYTVSIWYK